MPRWAKALLIVFGGLLLLLLAAVALFLRGPDPTDRKLGGAWEIRNLNFWIIDSGRKPYYLQRVHGRRRTTIADHPFPYRYLGDDCVAYALMEHGRDVVYAACADTPPILVVRAEKYVEWADLDSDPIRVNGAPISWADIKQHATAGRSF